MKKIKVGIIQQSNTADIRVNLMNLAKSIEACAAHGAQLIVLQELHNSLYFCQTENTNLFDLAEPIPGPSTGFYSELAAANKAVLVTSLFEKRAPGLYHNTAVVFDRDGSIAGKYRKMHIPDDPAYYEKFYFTPGDIGFEPIQTSLGKLGVLVCWDQWYPEAARLMALKGAELLIYPTAIGWESSDTDDEKARQLNAWIISLRPCRCQWSSCYLRQPCRTRARSFRTDKRHPILGKQFRSRTARRIPGTSRKRSSGKHGSGNRYGTLGKRPPLVAFPP